MDDKTYNKRLILIMVVFTLTICGICAIFNNKGESSLTPDYSFNGDLNEYHSPDGVLSFKYSDDWDFSIENNGSIQITLDNETLDNMMMILYVQNNELELNSYIQNTEDIVFATFDNVKKQSSTKTKSISGLSAIKNYYQYEEDGLQTHLSITFLNEGHSYIVVIEFANSAKELKNNFKALEQSFKIDFGANNTVFINEQNNHGVWDSKSSTYTNTKHSITWKLIDELEWIERPILTENTLLKVRNDDTNILVKLNVSPADGNEGDIWNLIPLYQKTEYQNQLKAVAQSYGMTLKDTKAVKSQLCGLHANKVKSDMIKYYPEEKITVHALEYSYQLIKNKNIYTLGVTVLSALEDDLEEYDRIVTKLVNGFSIK